MSSLDNMYRSINSCLQEWHARDNRKPLLVTGVRQCGKTHAILDFARTQFERVVYINFEERSDLRSVFDRNFDVDRILVQLSALLGIPAIKDHSTVVIFDEIQTTPQAVTALKYFAENRPELPIIASGSLLGVAIRRSGTSFPVGKVQLLRMYPMSFLEFLRARNGQQIVDLLAVSLNMEALPQAFMEELTTAYKEYLFVGGMPEAVRTWLSTHDTQAVSSIHDDLIGGYVNDFAKYAPTKVLPNLRQIWDSIPVQLAQENKKFIFSRVYPSARAKDLKGSLEWLVDAGLIYLHHHIDHPFVPLSHRKNATHFKVFFCDTGLLCRLANFTPTSVEQEIHGVVRGALTENFVCTQLQIAGIPTYFWRSDEKAEIDFVCEIDGAAVPVEVKAADNTQAKSYRVFTKKYTPAFGIKSSLKNYGEHLVNETRTFSVPLFAIDHLPNILRKARND